MSLGTRSNCWFINRVWVVASLLRPPGLFLLSLPSLVALYSGGFQFFFSSPVLQVSFLDSWGLFQVLWLWLVSLSLLYSLAFSTLWQSLGIYPAFCFLSLSLYKSTIWHVLFFLLIRIKSGLLIWIGWSVCISKSQRIFCVSFSRTDSCLSILHNFL